MISLDRRAAFLDLARPPAGFRLGYCIGATFSADIGCLLQLALNSMRKAAAEIDARDPATLGRLQDFEKRSAVFFQNCRLSESGRAELDRPGLRRLLSIFDGLLVPVPSPHRKGSFHPKVWLLRFDSDETRTPVFKLLVASRNLTPSLDWDVGCTMFGSPSKREHNATLRMFFERLAEQARRHGNRKAAALVGRAIKDLAQVLFEAPRPLDKGRFDFQWGARDRWSDFLSAEDYSDLIIVSPFLDIKTLRSLASRSRVTLVTTAQDLGVLENFPELHDRTFVMDTASENEHRGENPPGLHAKIYIGLRRGGRGVDILIGSANCTGPAFDGRNVEAMQRFRGPTGLFKRFERDFIWETKTLLRPYLRPYSKGQIDLSEDDPAQEQLDLLRSALSAGVFHMDHRRRDRVRVRFESGAPVKLERGVQTSFRLLNETKEHSLAPLLAGRRALIPVRGVPSDFVVVTLRLKGRTIRFWTVARSNLDRKGRAMRLQRAVATDGSDFLRLIASILGEELSTRAGEQETGVGAKGTKIRARDHLVPDSLLELLLLRAGVDEATERAIEEALGGNRGAAVHPGFARLWSMFKAANREAQRV